MVKVVAKMSWLISVKLNGLVILSLMFVQRVSLVRLMALKGISFSVPISAGCLL